MTAEYQVKGSSIESKFAFVKEKFGASAADDLRRQIPETANGQPLLDSAWYPFSLYDTLLRKIVTTHCRGSMKALEEAGRSSAEQALSTTYKAFARAKDVEGLLSKLCRLHSMYYSIGSVSLGAIDDNSATLTLSGAPEYSEPDLYIAAGFYAGAAQFVGIDRVTTRVVQRSDGADVIMRW